MAYSATMPVPGLELLGEILVRECKLSPAHLERGLEVQREEGGLIGEILIRLQALDEAALARALAIQFEMPFESRLPGPDEIGKELLASIPISFAKQHCILPLARDEQSGRVQVAIADPMAIEVLDDVAVMIDTPTDGVIASPTMIVELINKVYGSLREEGVELQKKDEEEEDFGDSEELVDILDLTDEAPIIRWVNSVLFQAVKERASDIHIEPDEKEVGVRYRVDGRLIESKKALRQYLSSIVARVKIMAGLDIAEKRLPQDGRIRRKIAGKEIDMRVATVPTAAGERVTIRLLDRSSVLLGLPDIGFANDTLTQIRSIIRRPHGIMLVTGPTGSGKTTTLYACLSEINQPDKNILTVEDPVEYQLQGISQTQVNSKIDLTFASGLRSFLRHDPDIIMVGEIRDKETAEIAITASLTGHLVLSTIHTNDSASAVTRLVDMGIEPFLVASSIIGLLAQRLVRRPCKSCAKPIIPSKEVVYELGLDEEQFFAGQYALPVVKGARKLPPGTVLHPQGCAHCQHSGYSGRTGIYELLLVTDAVRTLILSKADAVTLRRAAVEEGLVSLREDGARKCLLGLTTPEEVLMITAESD